jgi:hypothetical protein
MTAAVTTASASMSVEESLADEVLSWVAATTTNTAGRRAAGALRLRVCNATSAIGAVKAGATSAATAAEWAVLPARIGGQDATEAALALAAKNGASGARHGAEIATGVPTRIGSAAVKAMAAENPDRNGAVLSED